MREDKEGGNEEEFDEEMEDSEHHIIQIDEDEHMEENQWLMASRLTKYHKHTPSLNNLYLDHN